MSAPETWAIVLAGGRGKRFWPLSRRHRPKQCLSLDGGPSLLQRALARAGVSEERVIVVTGPDMLEEVRAQAGAARVIVEPSPRGTAPAIALGLEAVAAAGALGAGVCVLPADQLLRDESAFGEALAAAWRSAAEGRLVVFGVPPTRPETGFGWIRRGELRGGGAAVERFVEKPPLATAEALMAGGALWNAGIFAGNLEAFRAALRRFLPRTMEALAGCGGAPADDTWLRTDATSVDHGVMEPLSLEGGLDVVPLEAGWSDVGAWSALEEALGTTPGGSVLAREVVALEAHGNAVVAAGKLVALLGVEGLVVVDTPDALLVTTKARAQDLRGLVEEVERRTGARYT